MKTISKAAVAYAGLNDTLLDVLREWRPPSLKTELEYRDALFEYLRQSLPNDARLEKEYRHNGTTSDLYLCYKGMLGTGTEVFFELKRNLRKKVELDRLVGQIQGLAPERHYVFVVLIGELNASLVARLKDQYAEFLERRVIGGVRMVLVEVP